jgi:hypothetical protein
MRQHVKVKVVRFEVSENTSSDETSRRLWPYKVTAVLACGHQHSTGLSETQEGGYRPKRMACYLCPGSREVGRAARVSW